MKLLRHNFFLLVIPILIFSLGFVTLLSTSPDRAKNQLVFFVIGVIIYFVVASIDYTVYKYYFKYILGLIVFLLLATFILGGIHLGAVRWLSFGFLNIQPSEFAKVALIIFLASFLSSKGEILDNVKDALYIFAMFFVVFVLVLIQPDLGTAIILFSILVGILFYAGVNKLYFLVAFLFFGIFSTPIWNLLHDYQKRRILVFLNPTLDIKGSGYNVIQSIIAIGSGGIFGKGFGHGTQSHLNFLPAHWTDFIFASFAEEWGFVGIAMMVILFTLLLLILLFIAHKATDAYASLLVIGVFMVFFSQFVINVGMNLGVMPVTGIPLPLVSYGGSSLLSSFILLGIAQSVFKTT
ncbi:MAG TPA: rod shape-determining protein RodA [Candidatus Saccharimonadales bacterium]|nr:rod shape-determining protein RodA [Candidatus Saccharimonadales bacterium]